MELEPLLKSYGHFCQILALLTIPAHHIWSCHVTQDENFENLLFCPNSTFNIRKSSLFQKLSAKDLTGGGGLKTPPNRVKRVYFFDSHGV